MGRVLAVILVLAAAALLLFLLVDRGEPPRGATISVAEALQGDTTGFRRATFPASIRWPDDHGAHPDFKTEWWYFTGNLRTERGRPFGYQFTVFRTRLTPDEPSGNGSPWRSNQLYTGHFAVSDLENDDFFYTERASREAIELAGAQASPFRVWVEDWQIEQVGDAPLEALLKASNLDFAIDLGLAPAAPPLLHGLDGFSPKDHDSTNASYYYSFTRLETLGRLSIGQDTFNVKGSTWMDHEWSTSALAPGQVGWDWFALRLSDGSDIMYFQVRDSTGLGPFVEGTVREPDGVVSRLTARSVSFSATDYWTSPRTGVRYPGGWDLEIPSMDLKLRILPLMENQELLLAVRYWEGAVGVQGVMRGERVTGEGYVELTGYGESGNR
jgi:predicted secreted hydrolase